VLVAMESMSAQYLGQFGSKKGLTPNLDRLADEGLLFTNLYATGTRTVRGLEALMLSLPPTPGQSILRRPNSDGLFNLGTVFAQRGYKTQFVYGGYAVFDNMKEWFESNGFEVVDRGQFPKDEIQFGNAWGVCDEDLFTQVLKQEEDAVNAKTPFFQVVLTTSNHRPYTFPDGKIDIASHTGRDGAIKYSDFSIGRFIAQAKTKPWFDNTLFIFVADHDASVAGGTDIPVKDYLIPAIFYGPKIMPPRRITTLAAQLDLPPTLLGFLGFSYRSKFFGQDLTTQPGGRALLGTYQKVALLQPGTLTILAPGHTVETQELNDKYEMKKSSIVRTKNAAILPDAAKLTIAIYQTASDLFQRGRLKVSADSSKPGE
jgi:phosphoglycerol transferase MdoB-like AlkP superfamily enzyme